LRAQRWSAAVSSISSSSGSSGVHAARRIGRAKSKARKGRSIAPTVQQLQCPSVGLLAASRARSGSGVLRENGAIRGGARGTVRSVFEQSRGRCGVESARESAGAARRPGLGCGRRIRARLLISSPGVRALLHPLLACAILSVAAPAFAQSVRYARPYHGSYRLNYGFDHRGGGGCTDYACGGACYDGHTGSDFGTPMGTTVVAAAAGVV